MKDLLKNTFPLDEKTLSLVGIFEKWRKNSFTSQKISCSLAGIIFPEQEFFLKNGFFSLAERERKRERQRERETERQRETDRQTDTERDRERQRETEI